MTATKLPPDQFALVVERAPLVAIDLILGDQDNRYLLGLRQNEPARNNWFVPGCCILKNETLEQALNRLMAEELGIDLQLALARGQVGQIGFRGVFEHFYPTNFTRRGEFGTHYVILAHDLLVLTKLAIRQDDQHDRFRWFSEEEIRRAPDVHKHTKDYFPS